MRRLFVVLLTAATMLPPGGELQAQTTISSRAASLRVGGRLHTQFATSSVASHNTEFFFRRARMTFDVSVTDFFDARIQPEFAGGSAELKDAYVRFRFAAGFQVTMGQFKRAFDLFELASSTDLSLVERDGRVGGVSGCSGVGGACSYSRFTEKLSFADRDTGVRVAGSGGRVSYQFSMTNGAGANEPDENDAMSYSGRLSLEVAEGLTVSGQLARHDYRVANENEAGNAWGADVQYGGWRDGLLVQAAVVGGHNWRNPDGAGDPSTFMAFQGVASYFHPVEGVRVSGVEPLVRLSWGDPDTATDSDGGVVFTPGLMVYVMGKNKIGFNVDVWSPQDGDTEFSFKLQSFLYF